MLRTRFFHHSTSLRPEKCLTVTSYALLLYFTGTSLYFTTTSHVLHYCFICSSQQLHSNITWTSLVLHSCFTPIHNNISHVFHYCFINVRNNFTCTSLLLHLRFTVSSQKHYMHFSCSSLLLHSASQQIHKYFTYASLALHNNFTFTASSKLQSKFTATLHCCLYQLHNNYTCTSLLLH